VVGGGTRLLLSCAHAHRGFRGDRYRRPGFTDFGWNCKIGDISHGVNKEDGDCSFGEWERLTGRLVSRMAIGPARVGAGCSFEEGKGKDVPRAVIEGRQAHERTKTCRILVQEGVSPSNTPSGARFITSSPSTEFYALESCGKE